MKSLRDEIPLTRSWEDLILFFSNLLRRFANDPQKLLYKIGVALKSASEFDLMQGKIGFKKQLFRLLHSHFNQILQRRATVLLQKQCPKISLADAGDRGDLLQIEIPTFQMSFQISHRRANLFLVQLPSVSLGGVALQIV